MADPSPSRQCGRVECHPKHLWVSSRVSYFCNGVIPTRNEMLTQAEHDLILKLGECASDFCQKIMPPKDSYQTDADEFVSHIHDLQARVMANAAARCYPNKYRLQGQVKHASNS